MNPDPARPTTPRSLHLSTLLALVVLFATLFFPLRPTQAIATTLPPVPTVYLEIGNRFFSTGYHFATGDPLFTSAGVTVPIPNVVPNYAADVYIGAHLPNGRFASWVSNAGQEPVLVVEPAPTPFMRNVLLETNLTPPFFRYSFSGTEPPGFYLAYALLVVPGADPLDSRNWLDIKTLLFRFSP
jgi:hypothetical protein